jgi:hypothetical protein
MKRPVTVAAIAAIVSAASAGTAVALYDRQQVKKDTTHWAEMTCSFHTGIDSTEQRAAHLLVQVVTNAARSGNEDLGMAAYALQQDVVKFGPTSDEVAADRAYLSSLCEPILR